MKTYFWVFTALAFIFGQVLFPSIISYFLFILSVFSVLFLFLYFRYPQSLHSKIYRWALIICFPLLIMGVMIQKRSLTPYKINNPLEIEGRMIDISESQTQIRCTILTPQNHKILGIYYKPQSHTQSRPKTKTIQGKVEEILFKKNQIQLTLTHSPLKVWAIYYLSKKRPLDPLFNLIKKGDKISLLTASLKNLNDKPKYYKKKLNQGYTHRTSIKKIVSLNGQSVVDQSQPLKPAMPKMRVGDYIKLEFKKPVKEVGFFTKPRYLYAQKVRYYGTISQAQVLDVPFKVSLSYKVKDKIRSFFLLSPFGSLYNGTFLGINKVDSYIEKLFFQNDVIAFVVISGLHVNMIISFLVIFIVGLFFVFDLITLKSSSISLFIQTKSLLRYFSSFYILIPLSFILVYYLSILGYPQAASRAIFAFIIAGICSHYNVHTSYFSLLGLTLITLLCLFPYWVSFPIGMVYSYVAMAGIYSIIPIINWFRSRFKISFVWIFLITQLFFTIIISLFIFPTSLYFFHRYNFMSVLLNIPLSFLFFGIIFIGILALIVFIFSQPLALSLLKIDDFIVAKTLQLLEFTNDFHALKVYIQTTPPLWLMMIYYISLILIMRWIRIYLNAKHIKTT